MDSRHRKLLVGLIGIAILLIGVLLYAQLNGSHNFDLSEFAQPPR